MLRRVVDCRVVLLKGDLCFESRGNNQQCRHIRIFQNLPHTCQAWNVTGMYVACEHSHTHIGKARTHNIFICQLEVLKALICGFPESGRCRTSHLAFHTACLGEGFLKFNYSRCMILPSFPCLPHDDMSIVM